MENGVQVNEYKYLKRVFNWLMLIPQLSIVFSIVGMLFANLLFKIFPLGNGESLKLTDFSSIQSILLPFLVDAIGILLVLLTLRNINKNAKKTFIFGLCASIYHFIIYFMIPVYSSVLNMIAHNNSPETFTIVIYAIICIITVVCLIATLKYGKQEGIFKSKSR